MQVSFHSFKTQNNALEAKIILYILFFRKRFKVTMRPYDVRDVVEAFGAGQVRAAVETNHKTFHTFYTRTT